MKLRHTILKGQQTTSGKIVQLNEEVIKGELKELVRSSVEETLNGLLEQEAQQLTNAARYERSEERSGLSKRSLQPKPYHDLGRR